MLPLSVPIECGTLNATPLYTHRMWHTQCNPSLPPWNITCWFCYFTFCRNLGVLSVPSSVCSVILPWQVLAVLGFCFSCFHTYSLFFWVLVLYCVVDYFLILMAPLPFKKLLSMLLTFFFSPLWSLCSSWNFCLKWIHSFSHYCLSPPPTFFLLKNYLFLNVFWNVSRRQNLTLNQDCVPKRKYTESGSALGFYPKAGGDCLPWLESDLTDGLVW